MLIRRLDDYQSWMIEAAGKRLAIDPWLREELVLPPGRWMFCRQRPLPGSGPDAIRDIDALVLSAPFGDHCDPETLAVLPRSTPVFANPQAAKRARELGFTRIEVMRDGDRAVPFEGLTIEAVAPAFPYRTDSLGFVFEHASRRVYLETHVVDLRHKQRLAGLDVLIMPVQGVRLLGLALAMSPARALETVRALGPARVVPTGSDPQNARGFMARWLISYRGSIDEFAQRLADAKLPVAFVSLAEGATLPVS